MCKDAASLPVIEMAVPTTPACEIVESIGAIAATIRQMTAASVKEVALVTIVLSFDKDQANLNGSRQPVSSAVYFLNTLRSLVRKTDVVFLKASTMYFLLPGANRKGGQIVQSRLWDALLWRVHNISEQTVIRPRIMTIGHSAYPAPCSDISEFIQAASEACLQFDLEPEFPAIETAERQTQELQNTGTHEEIPALARKLGIPYLSLLPRKLPRCVQELVDPKLAQELRCYPVGRERNTLTVAMLNPEDRAALARLQQETGLLIFPVLTHPHTLQTALEQLI